MKKFILGLVLGVIISVSGSVGAITLKPNTQFPVVAEPQSTGLISAKKLSVQEQIDLGHTYDLYTGKKLKTPKLSSTEKRFRDIEARLKILENK